MANLVDKTIANMDELLSANDQLVKMKEGPWPGMKEAEKQKLYVQASMARCRRCGDFAPTFPVAGILISICGDCEAHLKVQDGCLWFAEMVAKITQKRKKS